MEKNDIIIIHGTDYKNMVKQVLNAADLAADIGDVNKKVALKPNLVTAKAPSSGATTHSELLAGTIEYLQENGFKNITVMEAPGWGTAQGTPSGLQVTTGFASGIMCLLRIFRRIHGRSTRLQA